MMRMRKWMRKRHMCALGGKKQKNSIGLKVQMLTAAQRDISERKGTVTSNIRLF